MMRKTRSINQTDILDCDVNQSDDPHSEERKRLFVVVVKKTFMFMMPVKRNYLH